MYFWTFSEWWDDLDRWGLSHYINTKTTFVDFTANDSVFLCLGDDKGILNYWPSTSRLQSVKLENQIKSSIREDSLAKIMRIKAQSGLCIFGHLVNREFVEDRLVIKNIIIIDVNEDNSIKRNIVLKETLEYTQV